jgi:hypothetical protein
MRPEPARKAFARARRLAKRPPDVQQTGAISPAIGTAHGNEKAAGIQRLFLTVSIDRVMACALGGVDTYRIHKMMAARVTTAR